MKRRYFPDRESLQNHYKDDVHTIMQSSNGYLAIQYQGGLYAFGVNGQILYINPEKELIGVYLGEDDLNVVHLFEQLCKIL